jgi:hypothetical protein
MDAPQDPQLPTGPELIVEAPPRRRAWPVAVAAIVVVLGAGAAVVVTRGPDESAATADGGTAVAPATTTAPAVAALPDAAPNAVAKVVSTIHVSGVDDIAAVGDGVWLALANGAIQHIDATTSAADQQVPVEGAGDPDGDTPLRLASDGDRLYAALDNPGVVVRLDATGRELSRHAAGTTISGLAAGAGQVWISTDWDIGKPGALQRIDPQTLAPEGRRVVVPSLPTVSDVSADGVWLESAFSSVVTRVDPATGATRSTTPATGPQAGRIIDGGLWAAHGHAGVLTRTDAHTLAVDRVVRPGGNLTEVTSAFGAVWALDDGNVGDPTSDDPLVRNARLYRIDPATGGLVGAPLELPSSVWGLVASRDALWLVDIDHSRVLELRATTPTPPAAAAMTDDPAAIRPGPLAAGLHRSPSGAMRPYTLRLPDATWTDTAYEGSVDLDAFPLRVTTHPDEFTGEFAVYGLSQSMDAAGDFHDVRGGEDLIRSLRRNDGVKVTDVHPTTLGGRPAISARVRMVHPTVEDYCGPCVPLFPIPLGVYAYFTGQQGEFVVTVDPPVVVALTTEPSDPHRIPAFRADVRRIRDSLTWGGD